MATSALPAAIDALVAALRAALPAVQVFDGPPTTGEGLDYICVGHDPSAGPEVADGQQSSAALGNRRRDETFGITCIAVAWSGDESIATRRKRSFDLLAGVEDVLRDNVTLTNTVRTAQLDSWALLQEYTENGASAGIRFRISCNARI